MIRKKPEKINTNQDKTQSRFSNLLCPLLPLLHFCILHFPLFLISLSHGLKHKRQSQKHTSPLSISLHLPNLCFHCLALLLKLPHKLHHLFLNFVNKLMLCSAIDEQIKIKDTCQI